MMGLFFMFIILCTIGVEVRALQNLYRHLKFQSRGQPASCPRLYRSYRSLNRQFVSVLKSFDESYLTTKAPFYNEISARCVDFKVVASAVQNFIRTERGKIMCMGMFSTDIQEINQSYRQISQLTPHLSFIPLNSALKLTGFLQRIERNQDPATKEELLQLVQDVQSIKQLRDYFVFAASSLPLFSDITNSLKLPPEFLLKFQDCFDDDGKLNGIKYPSLQKLRDKAWRVENSILQSLRSFCSSMEMQHRLVDMYVSMIFLF
jgi:hypothetical protein